MSDIYRDLGWLPRAPADVASTIRHLARTVAEIGDVAAEIRQLAGCALGADHCRSLARLLRTVRDRRPGEAQLKPYRVAMLSNGNVDLLAPVVAATGARYGLDIEVYVPEFGQVAQEALVAASGLYAFRPDAVLLAIDYRGLTLEAHPVKADEAEAVVTGALGHVMALADEIRRTCQALVVVQTLARPPEALFGNLDFRLPGSQRRLIDTFNRRLADGIADSGMALFDVAGLAEVVGLGHWHDPAQWNMAKIPFADEFAPLYADHFCRLINARLGGSRRALVLDLDNTVWGGVIGDDGVDRIMLAEGDPTGEAHRAVQKMALALRNRGIVLAVSSKNEDAVARIPFREHPAMILREDHIAVFQANWNDKASNIAAIADQLSLGTASFAFLDDNPAERKLVRGRLPEVAVPELPDDPAWYVRTLLASGCFEAAALSEEDFVRAEFYQDNARRVELMQSAGNLDDYLRSLDMTIHFKPFDAVGRARIAQLINKSNQFNLTTRRYTEAEVELVENDPALFHRQVRLTDTFGDNGMISVVICRPVNADGALDWEFDSWLMSCRVLVRRVEEAVLAEVVAAARVAGVRDLIGRYRPTTRNVIVVDHYRKLGFTLVSTLDDGETIWRLPVADYAVPELPMTVVRQTLMQSE